MRVVLGPLGMKASPSSRALHSAPAMCASSLPYRVPLRQASNVTGVSGNGGGNDTAGGRVPLPNAERQRRFRERRKEQAAASAKEQARAAVLEPARGYSWPPFEAGNLAALKAGIFSERFLTPRAEEILLREQAKPTWPAYLEEPVYERPVRAWARAEAMLELYTEYVEQQTAEMMSTEFGEAEEDITGDGTKGGDSARRSRTRKTGPSLEMWRKLDASASMHRTKLGLDPLSRARLGRAVAASQADMAQIMAQMDRDERSAS